MAKPNKETSMLCDVQYVKHNKKQGTPDYLYLIWRDLITQEKFMQCIPEPKMDIYFEKNELRTHSHNKNYERIENLEKRTVKYKDIPFAIADDMGDSGKNFLSNVFQTQNYNELKKLYLYPYVFGADYDAVSWYRIQWLRNLDNEIPKKLHKGFLDIEVDGIEVPGMPSPTDCPVNAVTLINEWDKQVYTFLLVDREFKSVTYPITLKENQFTSADKIKKIEEIDNKRKMMYDKMHENQHYMMEHTDEFVDKLHGMFDESYGELDYKLYYYSDERKMLVHLFQLINKLKLDFIGIWNISFDIPYLMERMEHLGLNPSEVMSHPDFPVKKCYFKEDRINHDIKNKSDTFHLTSYTTFYDQMELYASIRKGRAELRSYRLNFIANKELKDTKLDYSDDGDIKTLPYTNFEMFVIYNIKDVLLQMGIERRTSDFDTLYVSSYQNATPYDKVFKQTVKLRNVQYLSFLHQGLIPGENINIFNKRSEKTTIDGEEDEDEFEGALVADPKYNGYVGIDIYGKPSNNVFANAVDFDMSAFYPSSIFAMNIDPSTLIFKAIVPIDQYDIFGGQLKYKGITGDYFNKGDDASKELMDNFQTGNYMTMGSKWLNMPDVSEVYERMKKELS